MLHIPNSPGVRLHLLVFDKRDQFHPMCICIMTPLYQISSVSSSHSKFKLVLEMASHLSRVDNQLPRGQDGVLSRAVPQGGAVLLPHQAGLRYPLCHTRQLHRSVLHHRLLPLLLTDGWRDCGHEKEEMEKRDETVQVTLFRILHVFILGL